jgi:RimJ/RimL family protein N-acetyltransferase
MSALIRPITPEDIPRFRDALDAVAREQIYIALLEAPPLENIERAVRTNIEHNGIHLVAIDAGRVVGWCDIFPRVEPGSSHVGKLGMGVLARYRGQGIGGRLLAEVLRRARNLGFTRLELEVFHSNHAAIELYKKFGFVVEGIRRRARVLDSKWQDAVQMAQFLGCPPPTQLVGGAARDGLLARIEREAGVPDLKQILSSMPPTDLQSLLLEVYKSRAARRRPADLLEEFQNNRFVRTGTVTPVVLARWESLAITLLPNSFHAVELSPCCPLGASSVIASVTQDWAVPSARNVEIVSDLTNVLALESAVRRRKLLASNPKSTEVVNLAARHRVLRPQQFSGPNSFAHFSLFGLTSAGRDLGSRRFEMDALAAHLRFYIRILRSFLGAQRRLTVALTDFREIDVKPELERTLLEPLRQETSNLSCVFNDQRPSGRAYYRDLCFKIHIEDSNGEQLEVGDGGCVDWSQKLLSNSKERMIISAIGSERVCSIFARQSPTK